MAQPKKPQSQSQEIAQITGGLLAHAQQQQHSVQAQTDAGATMITLAPLLNDEQRTQLVQGCIEQDRQNAELKKAQITYAFTDRKESRDFHQAIVKSEQRHTTLVLGVSAVFILALVGLFLGFGKAEFIVPVITAIMGALGGYGVGFVRGAKRSNDQQ